MKNYGKITGITKAGGTIQAGMRLGPAQRGAPTSQSFYSPPVHWGVDYSIHEEEAYTHEDMRYEVLRTPKKVLLSFTSQCGTGSVVT